MSINRVALIFDNTARPETTGLYCRRALGCLLEVEHFLPGELDELPRGRFDLYLRIDDGLDYEIPPDLQPLALWAIDTHVDFKAAAKKASVCRFVFAAQRNGAERLACEGIEAHWLPLACDPAVHHPCDVPLKYDVAFVGNIYPGPRQELLRRIAEKYARTFSGRRYFEQMAETYSASRIVFNRSVADDVNMRIFEALGCGRLLLTNDLSANGQAELFQDGVHLATYRDEEELLDKLAFYLKRDELRERIATTGRAEVLNRHTYLHRMTTLLRTVERGLSRKPVRVPAAVERNGADERAISACLVSWKRPDNMRAIVERLLREPLIDDIVIWNNNPDVVLEFADPRVRVIESPENYVTYGRFLAAGLASHSVIYTQDDDCFVHNIAELYETFRQDPTRIAHGLKLGHLIDNPRNLFGEAHMALLGWGALFRREWVDVFQAYIDQYGEDELLVRKADRIFSLLLNRRHRSIPADVTDLPGTDGEEALSVRADHLEWTARAIERSLPLLNGGARRLVTGEESETMEPAVRRSSPLLQNGKDAAYFEFERADVLDLVPEAAQCVLDVGCGGGRLGENVKVRQQCRVEGIELDPWAAEQAAGRLDAVHSGNIEQDEPGFEDGAFDCVICADVLEHLRDPLHVLRKIRRWLRPDGCLVTSIPNVRNHTIVQSLLAGNWTYEPAGLLDADHVRFFTRREIEKLLFRAGFQPEEMRMVASEGYQEWAESGQSREVCIGGLQIRATSEGDAAEFFAYQYLTRSRPAPVPQHGLTSIIIATHNQFSLTKACIDSIRLLTDEPYELIFVDNASTDGTVEYLRSLDATVIENNTNRGFPAAVNQGIEAARGGNILLLNNDTIVTTGWLRRMLDVLHSDERIGLVGPVSNNVSGEQRVEVGYDHLSELDGWAWDWGREHGYELLETDRLVGFCLLFKREVVTRIGTFDERFGIGCFEDDDFCRRANAAGFKSVIAGGAFVHHVGSATFRASGVDFVAVMRENRQRYEQKWNGNGQHTAMALRRNEPPPPPLGKPRPKYVIEIEDGQLRLRPNDIRLSVCLIVRDNAATIGPCLESIRPWVDEMVVVDTGSTDDTPGICEELGARVFHWAWRNDFAAARNVSFDHARGEWLFWMDSDDTIPNECGRRLRELADSRHPDNVYGYVVQVHCPGQDPSDVTVVDHVKLVRNRPDLRFEFRIHEQIIPAIRRAGGEVAWTDIYVVHSGADHTPEGQARKLERDFKLLRLELADRPDHPFVLFNLGMTHADAHQYDEAVQYLQRCIEVSQPEESHLRKAYALLVNSLSQAGRANEGWERCQQGRSLFQDDKELLFRQAMLQHEFGRLEAAEQSYLQVLNEHVDRHFTSVDAAIAGYKARHNLALLYEDMGRDESAEEQWRRITEEQPGYRPAWRGLGEVLLRTGQTPKLRQLLEKLQGDEGELQTERLMLTARFYERQGEIESSHDMLEAALRQRPDDVDAHNQLCRMLFERGEPREAEAALSRLVRVAPDEPSAYHNLALVQLRTGKVIEATDSLRESVRLRPMSVETLRHLAQCLDQTGEPQEAAQTWSRLLQLAPDDPEARSALLLETAT